MCLFTKGFYCKELFVYVILASEKHTARQSFFIKLFDKGRPKNYKNPKTKIVNNVSNVIVPVIGSILSFSDSLFRSVAIKAMIDVIVQNIICVSEIVKSTKPLESLSASCFATKK